MNTHYALIVGAQNDVTLIASGPQEFCEDGLAQWIADNPLEDGQEAQVVEIVTTRVLP